MSSSEVKALLDKASVGPGSSFRLREKSCRSLEAHRQEIEASITAEQTLEETYA